ncbi:hypothetical protein T310_3479 [Rasamsonia emersonii CBS 393.64]|uniref:Tse2 ADP-ribosyltransferase toxin domain-containing protein n=1 Tax=Rasamsonia emersonii (strain ATCC 16479 / CBS 393.64 / IMI 116815) TaxID=1408163 RepID=A0A0F4YXA4_RASE3|nr:hypothetical protein T310_3479 [Rasamsonia emersonii CBS 393.64]KKA22481.1 hypothetical protein T310_3479 [Rasamsonia emersonii CBS 393.64]
MLKYRQLIIVPRGAIFKPNLPATYKENSSLYQENMDCFADDDEIDPVIICIPKGTPLPRSLILFRLADTHFELQPAYPMHLHVFNEILTEFYASRGVAIPAETWLASHRLHTHTVNLLCSNSSEGLEDVMQYHFLYPHWELARSYTLCILTKLNDLEKDM